jgi:hypothetical protein
MSCDVSAYGTFTVSNFTGKPIWFAFIDVATDAGTGGAIYDSKGGLTVNKVGKVYSIPAAITSTDKVMIANWFGNWNGYTAQTIDGKYSLSGGVVPNSTQINGSVYGSSSNCSNGGVVLCSDKGCVTANGTAINSSDPNVYASSTMSKDGYFYVDKSSYRTENMQLPVDFIFNHLNWGSIIVFLIAILAIGIAFGIILMMVGERYYNR